MVRRGLLVFLLMVCAPASWAQTESDDIEAAKLGLIEKLYEMDEPQFREGLANKGHSQGDINAILNAAYESLAACLVNAARSQAQEQGISVPVVLKSIGDGTSVEESKLLRDLDWDALHVKEKACNVAFDDRLAAAPAAREP